MARKYKHKKYDYENSESITRHSCQFYSDFNLSAISSA